MIPSGNSLAGRIAGRWTVWPVLLFLLSPAPQKAAGIGDARPDSDAPIVRYAIVVTGGELLSGAYADGHTVFLTRSLRPLGLQCVGSVCVDDRRADVEDALRFAVARADLIIVTGGLGPTDNDITREALEDFTRIPLREHPETLAVMARRLGVPPEDIRANLRRQTLTPTRGTYLKNRNGTAIGLIFETRENVIVALPGPPRELQPMVLERLVPYLSRRFGTRLPGCSITLRFVGLGQSQIDQTIEDNALLPPDVMTSSQFEGGRVDFTFSLPQDTPKDRERLEHVKRRIVEHLGDHIYAENETTSLEDRIVELLEKQKLTLGTAEVGTAGTLIAALQQAQNAARVLAGAYVAPTEKTLRRLIRAEGDQAAESLPQALADATGSDWSIVIGPVRPNADGQASVKVTFRGPDGHAERKLIRLRGTGEFAGDRLVTELLNLLRQRL